MIRIRKKILALLLSLIPTTTLIYGSVQYDLTPLASLNKILVSLEKGEQFGLGHVRGAFSRVNGNINFDTQNPGATVGSVILDSRTLRFGYHKVDGDAHRSNWLNSKKYPKITFILSGLEKGYWKENIFFAKANGILTLKNMSSPVSFAISLRYLRSERKKFDGKSGDLLYLRGSLPLSRGSFGINPGSMLDTIKDQIKINVSLVGCSSRKRPLLPSKLFI